MLKKETWRLLRFWLSFDIVFCCWRNYDGFIHPSSATDTPCEDCSSFLPPRRPRRVSFSSFPPLVEAPWQFGFILLADNLHFLVQFAAWCRRLWTRMSQRSGLAGGIWLPCLFVINYRHLSLCSFSLVSVLTVSFAKNQLKQKLSPPESILLPITLSAWPQCVLLLSFTSNMHVQASASVQSSCNLCSE